MPSEATLYRPLILTAAQYYHLDRAIIEAIVQVESAGMAHAYRYEPAFWDRYLKDNPLYNDMNPRRASASYGLMQIMYPVACERGFTGEPELLFVPAINLQYGCRHLQHLLEWSSGDVERALAAYNGGKAGNVHKPHRNRGYVHKVLDVLPAIRASIGAHDIIRQGS